MKKLTLILSVILIGIHATPSLAWIGMPTPPLHVEGQHLKDPSGNNVLLHGWMQPIETWFNGGGNRYSNPTDWTDPDNVAGMLNYLNEAANVMSDTTPKYGRDHGWYASFVRINTDFIGGWTQENGLENETQFNGWIQNFLVPYANHLQSRGLYLVVCATGPIMTPDNGAQNAGVVEQQRLRTFWSTVANAPGVKNADNIMFELMNEPVQIESSPGNGNWGSGSSTYFEALQNWMQPVIDDVRETGANNVIWVPCLGYQQEPHGWVEFPFTGSNIGIAAHYYPAYGAVYDNPTAVQNYWNSNYKPAADRWPMIITESYWFPGGTGYDDLFNGTTEGFGNALKNAMDNQGNVSYLVGFIADHLVDLYESTPENTTLGEREATQAYFSWLPEYVDDAPTGDASCQTTPISPYIQVNGGDWEQMSSVTINSEDQVMLGPQPVEGGDWSWTGCGTSGSDREQALELNGSCTATATFTNECGRESSQDFDVAVSLDGNFSFIAQHSDKAIEVTNGGTTNGTNVQQMSYDASNPNVHFQVTHMEDGWHRISPLAAVNQSLDVSGGSTDDGATIHTWEWLDTDNQQWRFEDDGNGYLKIIARHSNKCLDVIDLSMADSADVHQWECIDGAENQTFELIESDNVILSSASSMNATEHSFTLYPNPSNNGNFKVDIPSIAGDQNHLTIYTAKGTKVFETELSGSGTYDIRPGLSNGLYVLSINGAVKKFVVE